MSAKTSDDIFEQLRQSLSATAEGLRQVSKVVRASGFKEALPGYQQMRTVLLGQRLWYLRAGRHDLDPQWREITGAAREIADMLITFGEVMQSIARMDGFEAPVPVAAAPRPSELLASAFDSKPTKDKSSQADDAAVLKALKAGPLSQTALASNLNWEGARLAAAVARLVAQQRVRQRRYGKGMRISLPS